MKIKGPTPPTPRPAVPVPETDTKMAHNAQTIYFSSDSQLLAELGERLISTPQIALSELVKNSYDADASKVNIWLSDDGKCLNIQDDGHGMSEEEFTNSWMRIASSRKQKEERSRKYKRLFTGSKGVGRFAVRLLGNNLSLETSVNGSTGLRAFFPWKEFETGSSIDKKPITYWRDVPEIRRGTLLKISLLRHDLNQELLGGISQYVLQLQTPYYAQAAKDEDLSANPDDPGFKIFFSPPGQETESVDSTQEIFERAAIKMKIRLRKERVTYSYSFLSGRDPVDYVYEFPDRNLIGKLDADIRFLPKRAGIFTGLKNYDGRSAPQWVRSNSGVRVFDRGFRVPPYGSPNDDWLKLGESAAINQRNWESEITKILLPSPPGKAPSAAVHPALHLPANHQLIGYVSLKTHSLTAFPDENARRKILQPEMDRQGFADNEGFGQLFNIIRAGMEILAYLDLEDVIKQKKEAKSRATTELVEDINNAIEEIASNPEIPLPARKLIEKRLRGAAEQAQKAEETASAAEIAVETLGMLGVVAAFMTHEMTTMLREVELMLTALGQVEVNRLPHTQKDIFEEARGTTTAAKDALKRHIDYVQKFATNVRTRPSTRYTARAVVRQVIRQFDYFTQPRNIKIESEIPADLLAPSVPMSVYSGLILNLYTNALKAVLATKDPADRHIAIQVLNNDSNHIVRVSDKGVGVAPALRSRIFEPLFTTTNDEGPLGPGMGMGLYIVRRVVKSFGGKAQLVAPPDGFTTTFELRLPNA